MESLVRSEFGVEVGGWFSGGLVVVDQFYQVFEPGVANTRVMDLSNLPLFNFFDNEGRQGGLMVARKRLTLTGWTFIEDSKSR